MNYGTKHVGVRKVEGRREWECYDRATGSRIGPVHPTRYDAQAYAEYRQRTTFSA